MPQKMRILSVLAISLLTTVLALAQESTKNNYNGLWQDNASWTDGSQSPITTVGSAGQNIVINGYITLGNSGSPTGTDIAFENNHPTLSITIADTLVVFGDMTFGTDAMELRVPAGGLLIVFGNLSINNKTDISSAGNIIVMGQLSKSGSQGSISGSGNFYATSYNGGANGAGNAIPDSQEFDSGPDLQAALPGVYNFVNNPSTVSLPVELTSFVGNVFDDQVILTWSTASQLNFSHFQVEHSINAKDWSTLTTIEGEGTTNDLKEYFYTHSSPHNGKNYYRLRMVDLDETFKYSDIISANVSANSTVFLSPNPSRGGTVRYEMNFTPEEGDQLVVYDLVGGLVAAQNALSFTGELVLPGSLTRGTYLVRYKGKAVNQVVRLVVE